MRRIKIFIKDWLPPAIVRLFSALRGKDIGFNGEYESWAEASSLCSGYESNLILEKVLESILKVKCGDAVYERDSVLFDKVELSWPVIFGLMWVAAKHKGRLDVVDFGGSLGSSYFQNRGFLAELPEVRWSVVEQSHFVEAGREHVQDDTLKFYSSISECLKSNNPNVVLLSSVLEYLPNPELIINDLVKIKPDVIIVDRTPFTLDNTELITIQKVPPEIFSATLPCRILSVSKLINYLNAANYELVTKYPSLGGVGLNYKYQGLIFKRNMK